MVELDVTNDEHLAALADAVREHVDGSTASCTRSASPETLLAFNFLEARGTTSRTAVQVSAYSLQVADKARPPLMSAGGSVVGLTFDATVAWPVYDWMGVAKAAFESTNRYLARDLGAEGHPLQPRRGRPDQDAWPPSRSRASRSSSRCGGPAPPRLGRDRRRCRPPKAVCALLSDWFPATTGEIVHVDGGFHAMGV